MNVPSRLTSVPTDESLFVELLEQYHAANDETLRQNLERQILVVVDRNFRQHLRPMIGNILGSAAVNPRADVSARYTNAVNDFFVRVLEKKPRYDKFWQKGTLNDLRCWTLKVITNGFRDHYRREKRERQIVADHLAPLVKQRQEHFERHHGIDFEKSLKIMEAWSASDDEQLRLMADVLRFRYLAGLSYEQIAQQLGVTRKKVDNLRCRGIEQLRDILTR